jgi:maltose alpha-D-glucosyltransferase/alpha-amylase
MAVVSPGRSRRRGSRPIAADGSDPQWYKDAIIYEVHVRAFRDSNADGTGDFRGLTEKLDYLRDLGVTAIWILPFYPSPLKDDGYDIADYTSVHPDYGTLNDVRAFIREAHKRGLRVITELVCNHTSDQHPWFQRARQAKPGSPWRDFYVWSDTTDRYADARIIFQDFETSNWAWDPVAGAYYWHRFYSHQPDLNFENPKVHEAIFKVMDQWFEMGVDGLRLDAIPYLFEREGTNCENLPETHAFLRQLRAHVDQTFKDRLLLAEANQWPEDSVAYFGAGDECHMAFHFPVMPRMFMAVRMEDRFPIIDILDQTPPIPETSQWALFLRNHDELTLEMVTDEERDYMYRVYAEDPQMRINLGIRRRLAPLLGNHRRRLELMNGLLFSLPGTPVIYYGDEIGMGDNVYVGDRNGVRTPMQWSGTLNAGFSEANRQQLYLPVIVDPEYHYEAINVDVQQANPHSLLWWMKRLIGLRKEHPAFSRGSLEFLHPENRRVLAFVRSHDDETILVVANLSRFAQHASIDLSAWAGRIPVELFGRVEFPEIGDGPYFLSLGPHEFFWFTLEHPVDGHAAHVPTEELPILIAAGPVADIDHDPASIALSQILAAWARGRRWFRGKARRIKRADLRDLVRVQFGGWRGGIFLLEVEYTEGDPELYVVPLAALETGAAATFLGDHPDAGVARIRTPGGKADTYVLVDATQIPEFATVLLRAISDRRRLKGQHGEFVGRPGRAMRGLRGPGAEQLEPSSVRSEQTNSSFILGDQLILKLFRVLEPGPNPDLEIGNFLTERGFASTPAVAGALEYRGATGTSAAAIVQAFVPNQGDLFGYTVDALRTYLELATAGRVAPAPVQPSIGAILAAAGTQPPEVIREAIGGYLDTARLLGVRTAELHATLATGGDDPDFAPEPFSELYQRSVYQAIHGTIRESLTLLERRRHNLSGRVAEEAAEVLGLEDEADRRIKGLYRRKLGGMRIRIHGDFHAGQVLNTGRDLMIIDFEGEPARPLSERRLKRSPLRDVAGMIRSFHYAAYGSLLRPEFGAWLRPEDALEQEPWVRSWYFWVSAAFLGGYLEEAGEAGFLPSRADDREILLDAFLLLKAYYELSYELNNRPDWVEIPLRGILQLLGR